MSVGEFLAMGGYAAFVWPSFLVTVGLLIMNVVTARRALRRALLDARRRLENAQSSAHQAQGNVRWEQEGANQ